MTVKTNAQSTILLKCHPVSGAQFPEQWTVPKCLNNSTLIQCFFCVDNQKLHFYSITKSMFVSVEPDSLKNGAITAHTVYTLISTEWTHQRDIERILKKREEKKRKIKCHKDKAGGRILGTMKVNI